MAINTKGSKSLWWSTGINTKGLEDGAKKSKGILRGLAKQISALDVFAAISIGAALHIKKAIKESAMLAARYETLGVTLRVIGNNAGYATKEMNAFVKGLEDSGISMTKARVGIIRMAQAQLDLTKSAELARAAQNAAVIANIDSSAAFETMIHGISTGRVMVLRSIGVNVLFEESYKKAADAMDRSADSLTSLEKTQIRMDVVLEDAVKKQGIYEAAMETSAKQMLSLKRHIEDAKLKFGKLFTPALLEIVQGITGGFKGLNDTLDGNEEQIEDWGVVLRLVVLAVERDVVRLAMLIEQIGGSITALMGLIHASGLLQKVGYSFDEGWSYESGEKEAEKYAKLNVALETSYMKNLERLQAILDKTVEIKNANSDLGKAEAKAAQEAAEVKKLAIMAEIKAAKELLEIEKERLRLKNRTGDELRKIAQDEADAADDKLNFFPYSNFYSNKPELGDTFGDMKQSADEYMATIETTLNDLKDKEVKVNREKLEEILKDTKRFNAKQLIEYARFLQIKAKTYDEDDPMRKQLIEKAAEAIEKSYNIELQKIGEIGDAFNSLGNLISNFDTKIGALASGVGSVAAAISQMESSTTIFGDASGLASMASSIYDLSGKLADTIMPVADTKKSDYHSRQSQLDEVANLNDTMSRWQQYYLMRKNGEAYLAELTRTKRSADSAWFKFKSGWDDDQRLAYKEYIDDLTNEINTIITGTTPEAISDSISQGLMDGLDSAELFADTFESLMKKALGDAFNRKILTDLMTPWYDQFAEFSAGGLTEEELLQLKDSFQAAFNSAKDQFEDYKTMMSAVGFGAGTGAAKTGLQANSLKGVSEQTAGLLTGQMNALLLHTVSNGMDISAIRTATENTARRVAYGGDLHDRLSGINAQVFAIKTVNMETRDYVSVIMSTALENLKANKETAINTRSLHRIEKYVTGKSAINPKPEAGILPRAIGA